MLQSEKEQVDYMLDRKELKLFEDFEASEEKLPARSKILDQEK